MTVQFHDPRAASPAPIEDYELTIDPRGEGVSIGLLANGFPDSENFLTAVEAVMGEQLPKATFHRYNKGNASIVVPDEMLGRITEQCQTVVAAYGH